LASRRRSSAADVESRSVICAPSTGTSWSSAAASASAKPRAGAVHANRDRAAADPGRDGQLGVVQPLPGNERQQLAVAIAQRM
jgi:hypothetical protein